MEQHTDRLITTATAIVLGLAMYQGAQAAFPTTVDTIGTKLNEVQQLMNNTSSDEKPTLTVKDMTFTDNVDMLTKAKKYKVAELSPNVSANTDDIYIVAHNMYDNLSSTYANNINASEENTKLLQNTKYIYNFDSKGNSETSLDLDKNIFKSGEIDSALINEQNNDFINTFSAKDSSGKNITNKIKFDHIKLIELTTSDNQKITQNDDNIEFNKDFTNYNELFNEISSTKKYIRHYPELKTDAYDHVDFMQAKFQVTYSVTDDNGNTSTVTSLLTYNLYAVVA